MSCLKADLLALRNLGRTSEGRRVLGSQVVVLACVVAASLGLSGGSLLGRDVVAAVRGDTTGELLRVYYTIALVLPLLLVLGTGIGQFAGSLFGAPQIPLLLTAPVKSSALIGSAFVRALAGWTLFAAALGLPPVIGLAARLGQPATAALLYPLVFALFAAPVIAAQALIKVVLVRWFSSPRLRRALMGLHLITCTALALLAAAGLLSGRELGEALAEHMAAGIELPPVLTAPAAMLAATMGVELTAASALWGVAWIALTLPLLAGAARWHRGAYEVFLVTVDPRVRGSARSWPATPFRSFARKAWLASTREKGNLAFYAFLAVVMLVVAGDEPRPPRAEDRFPAALREAFELLKAWQGVSILIATIAFLGVIGSEQSQITLLATAPFARSHFLRASLLMVGSPFVVCLVVALLAGAFLAGIRVAALGWFLAAAVPLLLATLGLLGAVGTWPSMVRVHESTPLANNMRSVAPVLVVGALTSLALYATIKARYALSACYHGHGVFRGMDGATAVWLVYGIGWVAGAVLFALGYWIAVRNLRRLLGPQSA